MKSSLDLASGSPLTIVAPDDEFRVLRMKVFKKAIAALMLSVAVLFAVRCTKPDVPNSGENGENNGGEEAITVTISLINVSPTYLELKFEPSSNTAYYCFNIGGTLTSTTHQTGTITQKFTRIKTDYLQPDTEYEFSVVAYNANGSAGEIIHPKFKTDSAPYSNYYRVGDNFYILNYAKLRNELSSPNASTREKEIILWSEPSYWLRFYTLVYWYETDNVWYPGSYTTGGSGVGLYACEVYKNGLVGVGTGSVFTIAKSGNASIYDLYGDNGYITAHFTGVPTN